MEQFQIYWTLVSKVVVGENCLSLDPETKGLEYVPVIRTFKHPEDEMISFKSKVFDVLVTPNHKMLYMTDWNYRSRKKKLNFKSAEDFLTSNSGVFYRSCEWQGENPDTVKFGSKMVQFNQYIRFMAWYLSDGWTYEKQNQVGIAQSATKSVETREEIHSLLHEMGYIKHSHGERGFVIHNKELTTELLQYGKCNNKFIPEIIKIARMDMIKLFLETYVKADGYLKGDNKWKNNIFRDNMVFFTTSKRMADDIGELILKAGMRPSFRLQKGKDKIVHHKNGEYKGNFDIWVITSCFAQYAIRRGMKIERVPYNDMTYCVELEKYHTLWMRRNGKTKWIGNCTHVLSGFVEAFADPDVIEYGQGFDRADIGKSAAEMAKKYPQEKVDTRTRIKAA